MFYILINILGSEKLNNLPKVAELRSDISGILTQGDPIPEHISPTSSIKLCFTPYNSVLMHSFYKYWLGVYNLPVSKDEKYNKEQVKCPNP